MLSYPRVSPALLSLLSLDLGTSSSLRLLYDKYANTVVGVYIVRVLFVAGCSPPYTCHSRSSHSSTRGHLFLLRTNEVDLVHPFAVQSFLSGLGMLTNRVLLLKKHNTALP